MKLFVKMFLVLSALTIFACGETEREEGVININVGPEPKTIDPSLNSSSDGSVYIIHAFEGLMRKTKEGLLEGGVAENWDISDDGLTYTFYIKDDAKWSDGKPVTAQDFVYTWQRIVDPMTASEYSFQLAPLKNATPITAGEMPKEMLGVEAIDDKTLKITLEAPTAHFLELLYFPTYYPVRQDMVEEYGDTWTLNPKTYIGNGPFIVTERLTDDKIVMEKNTNYWDYESIVPNKLNFILMQNETAVVAGTKEGSLDFATGPPTQDIPILLEEGILEIHPQLGTYFYVLNITNGVLADPKVRRALNLVIDRNYIIEEVAKGGQKAAAAWVPYGILEPDGSDFREVGEDYFSVQDEDYQKNIEEAKRLLAEAGYPDGEGFPVIEFKSNHGAAHISIFEAIQQMWTTHLNIDSRVTTEEWAVFQQTRLDKQFEIARHGWIGDYNDPMTFIDLFLSYSPQNDAGYSNAMFDEYVHMAQATADSKKRMEYMHMAEDVLMEDMPLIPIYYYTQAILLNPDLEGVMFDTLGKHKFIYAYVK